MGRSKQPISILEAKGKKHLTRQETENRRQNEVHAPSDTVSAPSYLSAKEKRKFAAISTELVALNIMGNLDCDALARYIQSESKYLVYDKMVNQNISQIKKDAKAAGIAVANVDTLKDLEGLRDKALKQCRASASDLGLTISSRCKLVIPKKEEPQESKWSRFGADRSG